MILNPYHFLSETKKFDGESWISTCRSSVSHTGLAKPSIQKTSRLKSFAESSLMTFDLFDLNKMWTEQSKSNFINSFLFLILHQLTVSSLLPDVDVYHGLNLSKLSVTWSANCQNFLSLTTTSSVVAQQGKEGATSLVKIPSCSQSSRERSSQEVRGWIVALYSRSSRDKNPPIQLIQNIHCLPKNIVLHHKMLILRDTELCVNKGKYTLGADISTSTKIISRKWMRPEANVCRNHCLLMCLLRTNTNKCN